MRARFLSCAAAIWLSAAAVAVAASEPAIQLSPDALRHAATTALYEGDAPRAYAYAQGLLQRDPQDRAALAVHSRAARDLGQYQEARQSARASWSIAKTSEQKYASSMLMAQALASAGYRTRAQIWLRRAVHHAPSDALSARAVRDFRYVRARNPWLTRISFSITPDSNINNGSSQRSSFLNYKLSELLFGQPVEFQLGGSARALSGVEFALGITTRYRFAETQTRAHDLIFTADLREYVLSSDAKAIAPNADPSDFAFSSLSVGYGQRGRNFAGRGEYRAAIDLGQSWYGGDEYAQFARLSLGQSYKLENRRQINGRIAFEHQKGITRSDANTVRADVSYSFHLPSGALLWSNVTGAVSNASIAPDSFDEIGLRSQITFAKQVFGATAHLGVWARKRNYDVSLHSRDGRQDDRLQADFTLVFKQVDYYGFNPTMRISASKTNSNISLYDAKRFGVNFGIQSAF